MGWKLDALIVEKAGSSPEAALAELVGGPLKARGKLALDRALVPQPPLAGGAVNGHALLFLQTPLRALIGGQAPVLEACLTRGLRGHEVLALHLDSTSNSYGWARWSKAGKRVRSRLGDHKGTQLNQGKPLAPEKASPKRGGEEAVFALLDAAIGLRPDRDDLSLKLTDYKFGGGGNFVLEVENEVGLANPRPEQLESALRALRAKGPSFAILMAVLSDTNESYVQAGGSGDRMVVEGRLAKGRSSFTHASAGLAKGATAPLKNVPMSEGTQRVPANEVLKVADAVRIFKRFLAKQDLDPGYAWRDRTPEFKG